MLNDPSSWAVMVASSGSEGVFLTLIESLGRYKQDCSVAIFIVILGKFLDIVSNIS